jgi:pheromone shutdown protein TraB
MASYLSLLMMTLATLENYYFDLDEVEVIFLFTWSIWLLGLVVSQPRCKGRKLHPFIVYTAIRTAWITVAIITLTFSLTSL